MIKKSVKATIGEYHNYVNFRWFVPETEEQEKAVTKLWEEVKKLRKELKRKEAQLMKLAFPGRW